ncbi:unnamed protein product [Lymnaea stagnalis]|uniref:Uncharacterized protein n=1 Tax=Lymnaea stagnalis TaxID=6523 RepID=A0AAV2HJ53_LYMST
MDTFHVLRAVLFGLFHLCLYESNVWSFLLDGPTAPCPRPATHCMLETFNVVVQDLGCLGCQTGCQPGYIMTANARYYVTTGSLVGHYDYKGILIDNSKNVSEPQWLCEPGTTCPWGHFLDKMGSIESCSYCGQGCQTCQSFSKCDGCILGFRLTKTTLANGNEESHCATSGIPCPNPPDHCQHDVYANAVVGCQGCIFCEDGYLPTVNRYYRRSPQNKTSDYVYKGLTISGTIDINEPRYVCVQGRTCPVGYHNVSRGNLMTCEADLQVG